LDLIPNAEIIEENHSLQIDQQNGISFEEAINIAQKILKIQHN